MTDKVLTAYEDLEFAPLADDRPVQTALLWGNPETGPAAVMVKFPEGYREPWHSHTSTYHAVLVKGEFRSRDPEGSPESERPRLRPHQERAPSPTAAGGSPQVCRPNRSS